MGPAARPAAERPANAWDGAGGGQQGQWLRDQPLGIYQTIQE
jgi:hypothetical protein